MIENNTIGVKLVFGSEFACFFIFFFLIRCVSAEIALCFFSAFAFKKLSQKRPSSHLKNHAPPKSIIPPPQHNHTKNHKTQNKTKQNQKSNIKHQDTQ